MQLTNSSGAVVKTYTYEAFGSLVAQSGTVANPYQFQTKHISSTTGLVNFSFRNYNPAIGRFVTADPLGFVNGPNLYAYVGNNPVNLIDPYGLCQKLPWPEWFSPVQRAISGALGAIDKAYRVPIGSSQWYIQTRPFQFIRSVAQSIGLALGGIRVLQPWIQGNLPIEQAQTIAAIRGMRFMVVTAAAGWGAEGGAALGLLTGPAAPIAIPVFAAGGAVIGGTGRNWELGTFPGTGNWGRSLK